MWVTGAKRAQRNFIHERAHAVHSFSRRFERRKRLYAREIPNSGSNWARPINYY